jgi:hypothetical protein
MPPVNHSTPTAELDLSLEEQWAVHVALLEYVEVAQQDSERTPPHIELGLLEKIEDGGSPFTAAELRRLREECNTTPGANTSRLATGFRCTASSSG